MELEGAINEYVYYCLAKGFTQKALINKKQELKNMKHYLKDNRGITQLENIFI